MASEGLGQMEKAKSLFEKAWNEANTDFEKFTAAHFVARHQPDTGGKLLWDETALEMALRIDHESIKPSYPSLYLNIAKCHEDLCAFAEAGIYYELAFSHLDFLPDDGYGHMIRSGVLTGMERIQKQLHGPYA
jgi:rifampin ADP-ribosylating transferase